jgi:hypothetical protein
LIAWLLPLIRMLKWFGLSLMGVVVSVLTSKRLTLLSCSICCMTRPASLRAGSKQSLALCIRKAPFWTPTITACWLLVALCTVCMPMLFARCLLSGVWQLVPDTQCGFYPGSNTLQPMFILRHLQHAARTIKSNGSPRLHAAFIDFKQTYDNIPRDAL